MQKYRKYFLILSAGFMFLVTSCTRNYVTLPVISLDQKGIYSTGHFVWHDLVTDNLPAARDFYAGLFGWEYSGRGGDGAPYLTAYLDDKPVAGIIKSDRLETEVNESRWISYISVMDVERASSTVLTNYGVIYNPPAFYDDRGSMAVVGDEQGAAFGLITAAGGDPEEGDRVAGDWLWHDLITKNPQRGLVFYQKLGGYAAANPGADSSQSHQIIELNKIPVAGMVTSVWNTVSANWIPYIKVKNIDRAVQLVQELGGSVVLEPAPNARKSVLVADPTGAVVGLQEWPE